MDQILTVATITAVCLIATAAIMLIVCFRFASAVNKLLGKRADLDAAPAMPAETYTPEAYAAPAQIKALNLNGVDEKTAAMLMAIVANELGMPPDELRFLSIKEC